MPRPWPPIPWPWKLFSLDFENLGRVHRFSHYYFLIEKARSMVVRLPCLSLTETVSLPLGRSRSGRESVNPQREPGRAWNFFAKFLPADTPATGKLATTVKLSRSSPVP